ncbi:MAG: S9 family peptidase [Vicinamibacteria bacterium]|nr:S9 family peptidase [Vicinamibacteria bacterium]
MFQSRFRGSRVSGLILVLAAGPLLAQRPERLVLPPFSLEQVKSYPFPTELTAAASGSRIAWAFEERGIRNIYVAEGPDWNTRALTRYGQDDGQELTSLELSKDGASVVYVRGGDHGSNWDDSLPVNPLGLPLPGPVQIFSVPFEGGEPKAISDGDQPAVSPRGDVVAFIKNSQVWTAPVDGSTPAKRLIAARAESSDLRWSPDGSHLAFVSGRGDHAFVGVYANESTPITWIAPSTSRDSSPRWSPDGSRIAFVRRPGLGGAPSSILERRHQPWAIWTAEAATGAAQQLWKAPETLPGSLPTTHGGANLDWAAGGRIVFLSYADGWPHLYSIPEKGGEPLLLTPGAFMAEHIRLTPDRRSLVFAANHGPAADDLDRRHVMRVPVDRALVELLTPGTGLEWSPVVTGDGRSIVYLGATAERPPLPTVRSAAGSDPRILAEERLPTDFPLAQLVVPKAVTYRSEDGVTVHAQLFERPGGAAKKPAIVYVHGGPPRQMLLGWNYSSYYANAYALNQYLASRGFVVLSVNYRLGIGYGYEFHRPAGAGAQGAAEYLDVKAGGEYLRRLGQVDPARVGIYGGSYGGFLTALALGRGSDVFAAGVDIHGVHDFTAGGSGAGAAFQSAMTGTQRFEPSDRDQALAIAWRSSPVAWVDGWRSPVLLIHGDDDRNVRFAQTVDLAQRLSAKGVPFEELVIVDDTHHFMRHANQLRVNAAIAEFLSRRLGAPDPASSGRP